MFERRFKPDRSSASFIHPYMPVAALRPCGGSTSCPHLAGRCHVHPAPKPWTQRHQATRLRGRANQRRREQLFAREPLCRRCAAQRRTTLATIRDHIVPLAEGGTEDVSNEQPLCQACSDIKTQQEAKRGRSRA